MREIIIIAHNIRSSHNVGSLMRTCEGLGVSKVYLSGYTPYPQHDSDDRLPHIAAKVHAQIQKTALGAEHQLPWEHLDNVTPLLAKLRKQGFKLVALEQTDNSIELPDFQPPDKLALLLGNEVEGIDPELLTHMDAVLEIPMFGAKESFNVASAASMALYHLRFFV